MSNSLLSSAHNKTFQGLSYLKTTFKKKEFEVCIFSHCSFISCEFHYCTFTNCSFESSRISDLKPYNSIFIDTFFRNSKVEGVDWTKAQEVRGLVFNNCTLNYSNFSMLKLPETVIADSVAKECTFTETDFRNSNFKGTDFEKSDFFKTNLTKADFTGSKNYWIDIRNNNIKDTKFSMPDVTSLLAASGVTIEL